MPPPIEDIKAEYLKRVESRRDYLEYAQQAADLTLPTLRPKGDLVSRRPYTQLGAQAVRSLGSAVMSVSFPAQVKWLRLDADPEVKDVLSKQPTAQTPGVEESGTALSLLEDRLVVLENHIANTLAGWQTRSRIGSAIRRNLVEGSTLCHVKRDRIGFFPLRSFVVFRDAGSPRFAILRETAIDNPYEVPVEIPVDNAISDTSATDDMYTLVDWDSGTVWQQVEDDPPEQVEDTAKAWFVIVGAIPDIDHYPTSYVYDHLGIINEVNHLSKRLGEAAATAAWNIPLIRPGAAVTQEQLAGWPSGAPLVEDPDNLSWFTSGLKIGDWGFVAGYRQDLRQEMSSLFAFGIKDRAKQARTATEVLQIVGELDSHTQDLLAGIDETMQRPLVEAIMAVRGYDRVSLPGIEKPIHVIITTGQSALARETGFMRMVNLASVVKTSLDPHLGVNGIRLMEEAAAVQQFELGGIFYRLQQPDIPPRGGQEGPGTALGGGNTTIAMTG